ncbi:hypothetical protein KIW84_064492 [Lathyrus oleraceus]|uniref:non-specific serine/threonine protein kinase n=1 Tax=Pisum sativum TaxID=3888 RepID=A0A9D4WCC8_PEA|nr:hypothetical protein KIW84_064492 [Pisum sativum]
MVFSLYTKHISNRFSSSNMRTCMMLVYSMTLVSIAVSLSSNTDKLALLSLKEKLTNGVPNSLPSWNHSLHFCEWQGVTCGRRHKRVSVLHLENQTWGGTLAPSLGNLTFLRFLILFNIDLHGEIPKQVGRLKRLQGLDLSNNNLRGEIPMELTNCTNIKGSFGSVYRGSLLNFEGPIAVKVLNLETRGAAKSFVAECNALGKMKHRNLVKILTCCSSVDYKGEDFKAIVFEFMPEGSLENVLHNNEGSENENHSLILSKRVDIALDVAHALDYLHHDEDQVVVHCDIKPSNVLLDEDMVAHLGDFGLARLIHGSTRHSSKDQVESSTIKGTIGYLPPEYGAGGPVTPEGDIYSYGILLLEMLTGKRPTDNMFYENLNLHKLCKMKIPEEILDIVDSSMVMPTVEDQTWIVENNIKECLVMFTKIGVACSEEFPTQRMLTKHVILKLLEIKQKLSR